MSGLGYISEEPLRMCELCGVIDECRPYGANHEQICFECGQKDPETTTRRMQEYIFGAKNNG